MSWEKSGQESLSLVTLLFSYNPPPHSFPTTADLPPKESRSRCCSVVFEAFLSCDSKMTQNQLENDRKMTLNRLPCEGVGGGGGWVRGVGCNWKAMSISLSLWCSSPTFVVVFLSSGISDTRGLWIPVRVGVEAIASHGVQILNIPTPESLKTPF